MPKSSCSRQFLRTEQKSTIRLALLYAISKTKPPWLMSRVSSSASPLRFASIAKMPLAATIYENPEQFAAFSLN